MFRSLTTTIAALALVAASCATPEGPRPRVLILVVDGLRPDYVTAELMPRLNGLAESGVRGLAHHAVFPTVTRVNGPTIFTGRYPSGHGQMGNSVYYPDVVEDRVLNAGDRADLLIIDEATGGRLLTAPSLGELLEEQGLTLFAASSGGTGSGTLMNHTGAGAGLVHHAFTVPDTLAPVVEELLGPLPEEVQAESGMPLVARAVDALLRIGVDRADADVLAAWITEPDGTAHDYGMGAPETVEVLGAVDAEIGRLLDGLEERGLLADMNILVTSDHGFSSRTGTQPLHALLVEAGLKASATSTDVVVAGDAIHVREGGPERVEAIVRLLQTTDWIGAVFTRGAPGADEGSVPGTASFAAIGWDHARSADIIVSADWSGAANEYGYEGEVFSPGVAGHGSTSPWDIRGTFLAAGPAIRSGVSLRVPTGNIDLTPTAMALVGAVPPAAADGRVLTEIMRDGPAPGSVEVTAHPVVVSAEVDGVGYELTVNRTYVGDTRYFDGTEVRRTGGR